MTIQQLGQYLYDLGFILTSFFYSPSLQKVGQFLLSLGSGLKSGQGAFTVKVGNAANIGKDLAGLGFLFGLFPFLQPASAFVTTFGTDLALGMGTFGPVRVGNEGISGSVASNGDGSDTITFTIAAWSGATA